MVILTGFKNCGKSTLAKALGQSLGWRVLDTDDLFHDVFPSARAAYEGLGADVFRKQEREKICALQKGCADVIATGGGAMMDEESARHLKSLGKVVYLKLPKAMLLSRMETQNQWPAFIDKCDPKSSFDMHYHARKDRYEALADIIVDAGKHSANQLIDIVKHLETPHGQ